MDCLTGYIGLRGRCDDVIPESNLYINDLPGISIKQMTSAANEEHKNYLGLFEAVERVSIEQIKGDIFTKKGKYFNKQILLNAQNSGRFQTPYINVPSENVWRLQYLELEDSYYGVIKLNQVQLYLKSAGNSSIKIYDANDGIELDSIDFVGVIGHNIIPLTTKIFSYGQRVKIAIAYDANISASIQTTQYDHFPSYVITRSGKIAKATTVIEDNIDFDGESAGLVVNFNVTCEIDQLICQNRDFIRQAFWYLMGKNVMLEAMNNPRFNKYTLLKEGDLERQHDYYADNYDIQLESALDSIELTTDGICFSCSKKRQFVNMLP